MWTKTYLNGAIHTKQTNRVAFVKSPTANDCVDVCGTLKCPRLYHSKQGRVFVPSAVLKILNIFLSAVFNVGKKKKLCSAARWRQINYC